MKAIACVKHSLLFLSIISIAACSSFQLSSRTPAASFYVDPEFYELRALIGDALTFRSEALKFAEKKKLGEISDVRLTREEGEWIRDMGSLYLDIRENMLKLALREADYFQSQNTVNLTPGKGTTQEQGFGGVTEISVETQVTYNIDPQDIRGQKQIFRIQMALASALILMDNYLVAIQPYNENSSLRYVLNYDVKNKKALQTIVDSYSSIERRTLISKAIEFVDKLMAWRRKNGIPTGPEESQLYSYIQSSLWYLAVKNDTTGTGFKDAIANLWNRLTLRGKRGSRIVSFGLSMGFGNMVGLAESRKGYLYNMSEDEKEQLISEMRPLDILMEKTPFRLTDSMIPGHYGHVAIWLGTEQQLKELQVWDKIEKKYQEKIRAGHYIVEALRPGVEINTLSHFLNIDDFLVIRDRRPNISDDYRRGAILQAIKQIGGEYDFNFDVYTHERIVCSEIAYVVFKDIKWPTEHVLKRYSISPDNVAQFAHDKDRLFEPVIMYHQGKRVYKDLPYSLSLLLKADDKSYYEFSKFHNM